MSRVLERESEEPSNAIGGESSAGGTVQPRKVEELHIELTIGASFPAGGSTPDSLEELIYGEVEVVPGDTCGNAQRITARLLELQRAGLI